MTDSGLDRHDQVLAGLVFSLQSATMQHLGKVVSPYTGKVERDLEQARGTIDILEMLKAKCRTDTPAALLQMLDTAVMELQMNYLDEVKKADEAAEADQTADDSSADDSSTDDGSTDDGSAGDPSAESRSAEDSSRE